jgi:pimeloyl-ACP methyl ester carboxylesterase
MAETFIIVHGAWQDASAWAEVVRHLVSGGHKAVSVNLPGRNIASGEKQPSLEDYKQAVLGAIAAASGPVLLAGHSFGGFTISNVGEAAPEKIKTLEPIAKRWRFEALGGILRLAGRHFR